MATPPLSLGIQACPHVRLETSGLPGSRWQPYLWQYSCLKIGRKDDVKTDRECHQKQPRDSWTYFC